METYGETIQCKGGHLYLPDPEDLGCPPHCSDPRGDRGPCTFFLKQGTEAPICRDPYLVLVADVKKKIYAYV